MADDPMYHSSSSANRPCVAEGFFSFLILYRVVTGMLALMPRSMSPSRRGSIICVDQEQTTPMHAFCVIVFLLFLFCWASFPFHTCFVEPMTSPRTFVQSMLESMASSTKPQTTTLSPRIMYRPCGVSELGSGSSCGRIIRSMVSLRTRLVTWSQDTSVPISDRPSTVMIRIFSSKAELAECHRFGLTNGSFTHCSCTD
jgi:hypothetical protein